MAMGSPIFWETQNQLNPNDATGDNGPDGDPDHDGFTNPQEYLAGTDPHDPNSLLRINQLTSGGPERPARQIIRWQSVAGKSYQLYATPTVTQAMDPISGSITAYGATTSYTNAVASGAQQFYRVRVLP